MLDISKSRLLIALGIIALFGVITFSLSAATHGTTNKHYENLKNQIDAVAAAANPTSNAPNLDSKLAETIQIRDLMSHLNELQRIAVASNGTRAIGTTGFDKTVDFIYGYLNDNNLNLNLVKESVPIQNFSIKGEPTLTLNVNGTSNEPLVYNNGSNLATADFTHVIYSTEVNSTQLSLIVVSNYGCNGSDWANVAGRAVLVKAGGGCTNSEKGEFANEYNVSLLLFYNNGESTSNLAPISTRLRQANKIPALYLSYAAGEKIKNAINTSNASVIVEIQRENFGHFNVTNVCADTPTGDATQTIVIGSHSDSVPAGPGINDNGSGTAATLVLATNLARLYQTTTYETYKYRVRFCWWGAEEIGLAGSIYHVANATLSDYLVNLNYDMLGSPNYFFGIYDGRTARSSTPPNAINGSILISEAFRSWFDKQNLPWTYTDFSGRSDYGPFLAKGIAAGGLFSGADETKTDELRQEYENKLGKGYGGLAGTILDPCYHKSCDNVANINQFAYEKMVQAAAYLLEHLGQKSDLKKWLYLDGN